MNIHFMIKMDLSLIKMKLFPFSLLQDKQFILILQKINNYNKKKI